MPESNHLNLYTHFVNTLDSTNYRSIEEPISISFLKHNIDNRKQVFTSCDSIDLFFSTAQTLQPLRHENSCFLQEFSLLPFIISFLFLAVVLLRYRKNLVDFFESVIYSYLAKKIAADVNVPQRRFFTHIDILTVISFSIFIISVVLQKGWFLIQPFRLPVIIAVIILILTIYRLYFGLFHLVLTWITGNYSMLNELKYNMLVFTRALGIILLPISFMLYYSTISARFLLYLSAMFIAITLIYRTERVVRFFIAERVSLLYYILYLCALEIVPVLIIAKEIKNYLV